MGLCAVVVLLWCGAHDKWTVASWRVPLDYGGDSMEILARIKASQEGELVPFASQDLSRLGAPFGATWNDYLASDPFGNYSLGVLARYVGLGAAANFAILLAHLTSALAFYGSVRLLRVRRLWAVFGALLFAFAYFNFRRGLPHLWLTFTGTVPLALLVSWLICSGRGILQRPWVVALCFATSAVIGLSNPYNVFMFFQLLAWAMLAAWRRGLTRNWRLGLGCIGVALLALGVSQLPSLLHADGVGAPPLLVRNYSGTEVYALKPIELVVPPADHRNETLAFLGKRYVRWTDWRGETFSPYLGGLAALGLAGALWGLIRQVLTPGIVKVSALGLQVIWVLLFSAIGGVNNFLAFFGGLNVFRATNRYSIFLLAIGLFFLTTVLNRWTRRWPKALSAALMVGLLSVGLLDQVPKSATREQQEELAQKIASDQAFGHSLEAELGAHAMVFQLPALEFPEGARRHRLDPLDKFRPYVATQTLRFSFGSGKNRAVSQWKTDVGRLPTVAMVEQLEQVGFSAVLIERAGFEDEGEGLMNELAHAGRREIVAVQHPEYFVVKLHPVASRKIPLAGRPTLGLGWYPPIPGSVPGDTRWAYESASLSYYNPLSHELKVEAQFELQSVGHRTVTVQQPGRPALIVSLAPGETRLVHATLVFPPGLNRFRLLTDTPAVRLNEERWSLRAFGMKTVAWEIGKTDN